MLGNPKWFKRRKYSGWGLTPATWQGWVYLGTLICSVFLVFFSHYMAKTSNILSDWDRPAYVTVYRGGLFGYRVQNGQG